MMKKTPLLCLFFLACSFLAFAQERTITGKISEETNKSSIAGATITVKGGRKTVTADANGAFTISAPAGNVTLIISSIGFATKEVSVSADSRTVDILLGVDNKQLGEVVVTALGITHQSAERGPGDGQLPGIALRKGCQRPDQPGFRWSRQRRQDRVTR
jgi:hypothetical protein